MTTKFNRDSLNTKTTWLNLNTLEIVSKFYPFTYLEVFSHIVPPIYAKKKKPSIYQKTKKQNKTI